MCCPNSTEGSQKYRSRLRAAPRWAYPVADGEIIVTLQNLQLINETVPGGSITIDCSGGAVVVTVTDNKGTKVIFEKFSLSDNEVFGLDGQYGQSRALYLIEDEHSVGIDKDNQEIYHATFHNNQALRQISLVCLYILVHGRVTNSTFETNAIRLTLNNVGQGAALTITLGQIDITNTTFVNNHAAYQAVVLHAGANDANLVSTLRKTI